MVVTPKREKVTILLCAEHKTNDIISLTGMSHSLINTVKKLLKTGAPFDKRSRKPRTRTVRAPRLFSHLKKSIKATSTKSMRAHAKDLGISLNSVQCAVCNDLDGQALMRKCIPLLSEKNSMACLKRCRSLINHLRHAHSGRIIFFSDKKNFCLTQFVTVIMTSTSVWKAQKLMRMFSQLLSLLQKQNIWP